MLPKVIIHMGVSLDGRYDWSLERGSPYYEIAQKLKPDADLSGSSTMLTANLPDDPETAFGALYHSYIDSPDRGTLVVVDSRGRIRKWDLIKKQPWWNGLVSLCSESTPQSHLDYLYSEGIDVLIHGKDKIDLRAALTELHSHYGLDVIRVDSGGILNGVLLRSGLVDEVNLVVAPELVGGTSPSSMFTAPDLSSSEGVIPLQLVHLEHMKNDHIWLRYEIIKAI